ncbi:aminotransferase class I/II-fold pyridoxal phosphate-dependent enzyme [Zobellia laminariae]|uniref:aminotransferase class I/II-fold pyridoxal phosphate-dependent enzyme n=1 Tax=Zobellia laminariae TaxID=248906 RepID=UPI0026F41D2A|nr:pyridoxal phosphate-dependent aminotransferase family protein [Zobellia laminariae]WKX77716.1 pyridoxal phosphate-dependent aminotransferase family protein [Zobellia laminariae]
MVKLPNKLAKKLSDRTNANALRSLPNPNNLVDFSSNDYLGLSRNQSILGQVPHLLEAHNTLQNGATGSRLLSGNHALYQTLETTLCKFHKAHAALVFNSGYDANIGFFSSVPQRGDIVLFDEYIHASIRDGIRMGNAKSYKFKHNNLKDLLAKCQDERSRNLIDAQIYVVTESVFSMDGDTPDLKEFADICATYNCHLVVDEAHAIGVFGEHGEGVVQELNLQDKVFARLTTFGKGIGCHGAAILGNEDLISYLINFARSFIYTTGLPPHSVASVLSTYNYLKNQVNEVEQLKHNISYFNNKLLDLGLQTQFIFSNSAIHCCLVSGNDSVREMAKVVQEKGFDVRPILSPTVPKGQERLRICLHSFNTEKEMDNLLDIVSSAI